jgi:protein SCO1/2
MTSAHRAVPRVLFGLLAVVGLLVGACGASPAPAVSPPSAFIGTQVDKPTPASILRLPLTTSDGQKVNLASFHGEFLVLCDVMTLGRTTSPLDTAAVVRAARAVEEAGLAGRVRFLSITIDPRRDTPARLAAYRKLYVDAPADWTLLTAGPDVIASLWNHFSVYRARVPEDLPETVDWMTGKPMTYTVVHNDQVHFLDLTYHDRFVLGGPAHVGQVDSVPAALGTFLDGQGRHDLKDPDLNTWDAQQVLNVLSWLTARQITPAVAP